MLDRFSGMSGVAPSYYRAKIMAGLTLKGHLVLNNNILPASVFEVNGVDYIIDTLLKIDGWVNYHFKIKRCDKATIGQTDLDNLTKNLVIKIKYAPIQKTRPGYDL